MTCGLEREKGVEDAIPVISVLISNQLLPRCPSVNHHAPSKKSQFLQWVSGYEFRTLGPE